MPDSEVLKAICCLAGSESEVTVEELLVLGELAKHAGLERGAFNMLVAKARDDESLRQEQTDLVMNDVDRAMSELVDTARESNLLEQGHVTMLLWRMATKLGIDAGRFDELLETSADHGS